MPDVVDLLRALARHEHDDLSVGEEAADEIEALRKENEGLRISIKRCIDSRRWLPELVGKKDD